MLLSRQIIKPSKFLSIIKKLIMCDEKYKSRAIEVIAESLKPVPPPDIIVSDDPCSIYSIPTSYVNTGTLGSSCMRIEKIDVKDSYLKFYNLAGTKIAYILDMEGKLQARALLWENVKEVGTKFKFKYMDRIYASEQNTYLMQKWAKENGYGFKRYQTNSCSEIVCKDKIVSEFYYSMKEDILTKIFQAPYLDTLYHLSKNGKVLHTHRGVYKLRSTCGWIGNLDVRRCNRCNNYYRPDNYYFGVCPSCLGADQRQTQRQQELQQQAQQYQQQTRIQTNPYMWNDPAMGWMGIGPIEAVEE
jgi:hypothetical protein